MARLTCALMAAVTAALGAQVSPIETDGSLGPVRGFDGNDSRIPAELGRDAFPNLFHSFKRFNIPSAGRVTFTGSSFANILVRVTGPEGSSIDGTVGSDITGANLFLFNPRGILFGPNARLDLTGSFAASTANRIVLDNGTEFAATATPLPETSLLTAAPSAFGFLGPVAATLTAQGAQLTVAPGQQLSLVGGEVTVERSPDTGTRSQLIAPEGSVTLAAVDPDQLFPTPGSATAPPEPHPAAGSVTVSGGSRIGTRLPPAALPSVPTDTGASPPLSSRPAPANPAGPSIFIRGGKILITGRDTTLLNPALGNDRGGRVDLAASRELRFEQGAVLNANSGQASGAGRQVDLRAPVIAFDRAKLEASVFDAGDGPQVRLSGNDITLSNEASITAQNTEGTRGRGAVVRLEATGRLTLESGARLNVDTYATAPRTPATTLTLVAEEIGLIGNHLARDFNTGIVGGAAGGTAGGGTITLTASTITLSAGAVLLADTFTEAPGSQVRVNTERLSLQDGASISSEAHANGPAGSISLTARESIHLEGTGSRVSTTSDRPASKAGRIELGTPDLTLDAGARITAEGTQGVLLVHGAESTDAPAASVTIRDRRADVPEAEPRSGIYASGAGGFILVESRNLTLDGTRAGIYANADYEADTTGASINLLADRLSVREDARISVQNATPSDGLSLRIQGTAAFAPSEFIGLDGAILAGTQADGPGSDVVIQARTLELESRGLLETSTRGRGAAGDIKLLVDNLSLTGNATIRSESGAPDDLAKPTGPAGRISLSGLGGGAPSQRVTIQGATDTSGPAASPSFARISTASYSQNPAGSGGDMVLHTEALSIAQGGLLSGALAGEGGDIDLFVDNLSVTDGGIIAASTVDGLGGTIRVRGAGGNRLAGDVRFGSVNSTEGGSIFVGTTGTGKAGDLFVDARRVTITGRSVLSSTSSGLAVPYGGIPGDSGSITLRAQDSLKVIDVTSPAAISVAAEHSNAGTVNLSSEGDLDVISSRISASGNRGTLTLTARGLLRVENAALLARSTGKDNGGNIRLTSLAGPTPGPGVSLPGTVVLNHASLLATAVDGRGGNINIVASTYAQSADTTIELSNARGEQTPPRIPEFSFEPPPDPPKSQTEFEVPPLLEAVAPEASDDPEGYTRVGYRATPPLEARRRLTFGGPRTP